MIYQYKIIRQKMSAMRDAKMFEEREDELDKLGEDGWRVIAIILDDRGNGGLTSCCQIYLEKECLIEC